MLTIILGILEQGLIFGIIALGVLITYKILDFPDLTVDGSYPLAPPSQQLWWFGDIPHFWRCSCL